MKMDRRLTNGLAWAGALLVIGIPAADFLAGKFSNPAAPTLAVVDATPAQPAATPAPAVTPAATAPTPATKPPAAPQAVASANDPVGGFLQSGRPLPSYITGAEAPAAAKPATPSQQATQPTQPPVQSAATRPANTPATTVPGAAATPPAEQVAALPPKVAPVPMPASMRPSPVRVPLANTQPLIIDQAPVMPATPTQNQQDYVSAEDLESWESGPLSEFLARRGQQSSANYRVQQNAPAYQDNGFWLDEGPRNDGFDDEVYYTPY